MNQEDETLEVGAADQALLTVDEYQRGGSSPISVDMGSSDQRSCFLSGVTGALNTSTAGGVSVIDTGGKYQLNVMPRDGALLKGFAQCMPSGDHEIHAEFRTTGEPFSQQLAPAVPTRSCFLTRIEAGGRGFSSPSDFVEVVVVNRAYVFRGKVTGNVLVEARCADGVKEVASNTIAAGNGSAKVLLAGSEKDAAACALTRIQGAFNRNDFSDGVFVSYDETQAQFELRAKNLKQGRAVCLK